MTPAERDEIGRLCYGRAEVGNKPLWNYYVAMRDPAGNVIGLHGPLPTLHDALYSQLSYKIDLGDWWLSQGYCVTEVFQADSCEEAQIAAAKCKCAGSHAYDASRFQRHKGMRPNAASQTAAWYRTRIAAVLIVAFVVILHVIAAFLYGRLNR